MICAACVRKPCIKMTEKYEVVYSIMSTEKQGIHSSGLYATFVLAGLWIATRIKRGSY